jgi:fatty acid-binding protein DegV
LNDVAKRGVEVLCLTVSSSRSGMTASSRLNARSSEAIFSLLGEVIVVIVRIKQKGRVESSQVSLALEKSGEPTPRL